MAKIIWTEEALEDLHSIHEFISRDSPFYADKFIDKLISKADILIKFPKLGKPVPEFDNVKIRELIEGNYRTIYRIESSLEIGIVRIHHSSRILKRP
jgi:addiction module RelE/StbE family toxin